MKRGETMKTLKIFMLMIGLLFAASCTNAGPGTEERNPRENLEFFYNAEVEEEEPEEVKIYYRGERYYKDY